MEKILNINIEYINLEKKYCIDYLDSEGEMISISLPINEWNKNVIVSCLIRSKYSQDTMEAIVNNHFLNIAEWIDKKISGSTEPFIDPEYDEMQRWRKVCKKLADEALQQYPEN